METLPYSLISVVQDLQGLLQAYGVARAPGQLLSSPDPRDAERLSGVQADLAQIEEHLRAAGCLLANSFVLPTLPLLKHCLARLWLLDSSLSGELLPEVRAYYGLLREELDQAPFTSANAYWLCGEVMALYLDLLATVRADGTQLLHQTHALRELLQQRRLT
jgi:hypothetical protein